MFIWHEEGSSLPRSRFYSRASFGMKSNENKHRTLKIITNRLNRLMNILEDQFLFKNRESKIIEVYY